MDDLASIDSIPSDVLFEEIKNLRNSLLKQYNDTVIITRKILIKVKHLQESSDEILLVPKAPMSRWLNDVGLSNDSYKINEFLNIFFGKLSKEGRIDFTTMTLQLTPAEMRIFQSKESTITYFRFMSHLPSAFA